jgi:putative two-component system response regulator
MGNNIRQVEALLAVDDDESIGRAVRFMLGDVPLAVDHARNITQAQELLRQRNYAVVLCDVMLGEENGLTLLQELSAQKPDTAVVMMSGLGDLETAVSCMRMGAWDWLVKPFTSSHLKESLERVNVRRRARREAAVHWRSLETLAADRNRTLQRRSMELLATQRALLRSFCQMAEFRDPETGNHLLRMAHYARTLAAHLMTTGPYTEDISAAFVDRIYEAAPLHDVGKVGIPDHVLLKAGPLTPDERVIMETHAALGGRALEAIRAQLPPGMDIAFLDMAVEVATCHHERFDGSGYPRRLRGDDIPLSARVVSVADFYDACSSPRVYRPVAMPHAEVAAMVRSHSGRAFDPAVVEAFLACEPEILRIRQELADQNHLVTPPLGAPVPMPPAAKAS